MSEEQDPSPEYIKAFNNGYVMQQQEPELLEKLLAGNEHSEQIKVMKAGKQQYERERLIYEMQQAKQRQKDNERTR